MSAQKRIFKSKYFSISVGSVTLAAIALVTVIAACTGEQAKAKPNFVYKDAPSPGVVAKINGELITEETLVGDDRMDFFDLKKREYELKMERLNKLLVDRILGAQAKAAGMSTEDYVSKKVVGGDIKISDRDYKKFVEEKHIPQTQINDQVKQRIMAYLKEMKKQELVENAVAKATKNNPVEVYFSKPKMQINVDPGNSPMAGGANAKVTVVEFSDFQCPFCGRAAETVSEVKKKYGNKIKLYFRNFPLPMHKDARPAANAAMCVNEQGVDKFWKLHDLMFKNQDKLDSAHLAQFAKQAGADEKKFSDCVAAKKFDGKIQEDMSYGEKIGVRSTPTFFINGQLVNGAVPLDNFSEVIDEELSAAK